MAKESAQPEITEENQPVFRLLGQYVKDSSFECPRPVFFDATPPKAKFQLEVGVQIGQIEGEEDLHEVLVILRGNAKDDKDRQRYVGEVVVAGIFMIKNVEEEKYTPSLAIDGASLLFPSARHEFMSGVLGTSFPAPMIGPIDFQAIYIQSQKQKEEQAKKEGNAK